VQDARVLLPDDFSGLISVEETRSLVPQEDLAIEILADDRILGG
jgi:hypothetical protein